MKKALIWMKKLLIILGPTSTGKTDLALKLAKIFDGELISCDSRQVYCGLDIGTGKLPNGRWKVEDGTWEKKKGYWEIDGVKIWMYDVVDPKRQYNVADYVQDASKIIDEIFKRGKLPIIVGGTGFYLKALLEGLPSLAIPIDQKLRKQLNNLTTKQLQQKLQQISPDKWNNLNESDRQNPRRLIRAIEMEMVKTKKNSLMIYDLRFKNWNILKIGLIAPREILYRRIDERVIRRISQGMIDEAKNLHKNSISFKRMRQLGLEYGVLADYLQGKFDKINLIKIMQRKIHSFVRRQLTWFKKEKDINWFDITESSYLIKVANLVTKWYDSSRGSYAKKD